MNPGASPDLLTDIQALLADVFQVPTGEIHPELAFGDLPQWDSLGHMEVMVRLEEQFGAEITASTIAELTSVPAIYSYLSGNQARE